VFERRMNEMTRSMFSMRLDDMVDAERRADVPVLVLSPTSVNDGRRVLIGAQPLSFLTCVEPLPPVNNVPEPEAIEFRRLFADQEAGQLTMLSALRMGASFPYITPVVTLPSSPAMRVMDAGVRDNYGYRTTLQYIQSMREWIRVNTSGVVILQLRDKQKDLEVKPVTGSLISRLLDPVGSVYDNFVKVQDQDYDLMLKQADAWADFPIDMVDLQLRHDELDEISLSWHLTAVEKEQVLHTIGSAENRAAFERLRELVLGSAPLLTTIAPGGTEGARPSDPQGPR
jgi:hypothetical protein